MDGGWKGMGRPGQLWSASGPIFEDGVVSEVVRHWRGWAVGGQDKSPIKQIKNNSRNYRPHWTGASPWMRRME